MAREVNRFTDRSIKGRMPAGKHHDGGGLYVKVTPEGTKSFMFRFTSPVLTVNGTDRPRDRWMGLGGVNDLTLSEAREKARECRRMVKDGTDPILAREEEKAARKAEAARHVTFEKAAEAYIANRESLWGNIKHIKQWRSTLGTYAYPVIGSLPVGMVETPHILEILEPLWGTKRETASRLRGRIESILDDATIRGNRPEKPNPARWKGHLDKVLAPQIQEGLEPDGASLFGNP